MKGPAAESVSASTKAETAQSAESIPKKKRMVIVHTVCRRAISQMNRKDRKPITVKQASYETEMPRKTARMPSMHKTGQSSGQVPIVPKKESGRWGLPSHSSAAVSPTASTEIQSQKLTGRSRSMANVPLYDLILKYNLRSGWNKREIRHG